MADGQHRLGIHHMVEIAVGNGDEITQADLAARPAMVNAHGLITFVKMVMIGFELGLELLGRGVLAMGFR
jgi:hypothetical protein